MQGENTQNIKKHCLSLSNRTTLVMSGVSQVNSFDEETVSLDTSIGRLTVEGKNLHVTKLSTDTGDIAVEGKINAIYYSDESEKKSGFFSRLVK